MPIVFLILFNILIFFPTWKYKIIVDDIGQLKQIRNEDLLRSGCWTGFNAVYRFILTRLYGLGTFLPQKPDCDGYVNNTNIWYQTLYFDHIFQTVLHTIISILIYIVFGQNQISLCAAALYSINPITAQTAIWLNGRRYAIAIIMILLMLILKPLGFVLYPALFLFHYTGWLAPLLLGWIGIPIIAIIVLLARKQIKSKIDARLKYINNQQLHKFYPKRIIVIIKSYGLFLTRIFFPKTPKLVHSELYWYEITNEGNKDAYAYNYEFYQGLVCIIASIASLFILQGDLFFYWLFSTLTILSWSTITSAVQVQADRYISATVPFLMVFLSLIIHKLAGFYTIPIVACFCIYYFLRYQQSFRMFEDFNSFCDYHIYHDPKHPYWRFLKASEYMRCKNPMAAWPLVTEGLLFAPKDFRLLSLASQLSFLFGAHHDAVRYLLVAEKNYYLGQEPVLKLQIESLKQKLGLSALQSEAQRVRTGTSKLSKTERDRVLKNAQTLGV